MYVEEKNWEETQKGHRNWLEKKNQNSEALKQGKDVDLREKKVSKGFQDTG